MSFMALSRHKVNFRVIQMKGCLMLMYVYSMRLDDPQNNSGDIADSIDYFDCQTRPSILQGGIVADTPGDIAGWHLGIDARRSSQQQRL